MGLFNSFLGTASKKESVEIEKQLETILIPDESIDMAFQLIRDLIVFTNRRLILVDIQGVTSKRVEYKTIPYKAISRFSVETAGHFDLDAELKIWISGAAEPTEILQFKNDDSIIEVQRALAIAILD